MAKQFVEVLIAPAFSAEALAVFAAKTNARVLQIDLPPGGAPAGTRPQRAGHQARRLGPADPDRRQPRARSGGELKVVTTKQPTPEQMRDLLFAWKVAKYVKSNAIVFCAGGMTLGVGAGQMSRLDSARIASDQGRSGGPRRSPGSAVASDAFFPFRDGLDVVIDAGATCVIQPGGSMRDDEVIAAANERGVAMVFTGVRHFRH